MAFDPTDYLKQALSAGQGVVDQRSKAVDRSQQEWNSVKSIASDPQMQSPNPASAVAQSTTPPVGGVTTPGQMNPSLSLSLQKLMAGSGGKIKIESGHRDTAEQQKLWDAALAKYGSVSAARKWVAPPGTSMHEKGLAADLHFADDASRQWAHDHAAEYGLWFPLSNEAWHIELKGSRGGK